MKKRSSMRRSGTSGKRKTTISIGWIVKEKKTRMKRGKLKGKKKRKKKC
jgi:hypothetical protein